MVAVPTSWLNTEWLVQKESKLHTLPCPTGTEFSVLTKPCLHNLHSWKTFWLESSTVTSTETAAKQMSHAHFAHCTRDECLIIDTFGHRQIITENCGRFLRSPSKHPNLKFFVWNCWAIQNAFSVGNINKKGNLLQSKTLHNLHFCCFEIFSSRVTKHWTKNAAMTVIILQTQKTPFDKCLIANHAF